MAMLRAQLPAETTLRAQGSVIPLTLCCCVCCRVHLKGAGFLLRARVCGSVVSVVCLVVGLLLSCWILERRGKVFEKFFFLYCIEFDLYIEHLYYV